jgi:hypothetical protein
MKETLPPHRSNFFSGRSENSIIGKVRSIEAGK